MAKYFLDQDYVYDVNSKISDSDYHAMKFVSLSELSASQQQLLTSFLTNASNNESSLSYTYYTVNNLDVFLIYNKNNEINLNNFYISGVNTINEEIKTIKFIKKISKNVIKIVF